MNLSRRLIWSALIPLVCTALLGAAALIGMRGMSGHFETAAQQYDQLRALYDIGHRAAMVRQFIAAESPDRSAIDQQLSAALAALDELKTSQDRALASTTGSDLLAGVESIEANLQRALDRVADGSSLAAASADINATLGQVAALATTARTGIVQNRQSAAARLTATIWVMAALFVATIGIGIIVAVAQHHNIMRPVRSLERGVAQLAQADFNTLIPESGDREFRQLIQRFNDMSSEIHRLDASMRQQVESKSRQLVRSEQLASLGYLAAGLAHEINNPLGIIAGYAESTLRKLKSRNGSHDAIHDDELLARTEQTLNTICAETFRCRDITRELLEIARPRHHNFEPVAIAGIVRRATSLIRGLPLARERDLVLHIEDDAANATVNGDESQLIQVLINLVMNGLEACEPNSGRVVVAVERRAGYVDITVTDNGCGMNDQALQHAFDPFFTDKARRGLTGTGLGLSVSHAIAERHRGRLFTHSDGPNQGSVLTLELPVDDEWRTADMKNERGGPRKTTEIEKGSDAMLQ